MTERKFSYNHRLLVQKIHSLMNGLPGLLAEAHKDHVKSICREIYDIGFEDGQKAVFSGDPDYPKPGDIAVVDYYNKEA